MSGNPTPPGSHGWSPQRRHWLLASIVVPLLCVGVTATVTLITTLRRDDPPPAASQTTGVAPPDQSKACGPLDDEKIAAGWGPDRPTVTGQQFTATADRKMTW